MTSTESALEIVWLVACLAPDDIAPHPNFGAPSVTGPELLALIAKLQTAEYSSYRATADNSLAAPVQRFLDCVLASLTPGSVDSGMKDLVTIANDEPLSYGAKAAALIFATVAAGELDLSSRYIDQLVSLAELIQAHDGSDFAVRKLAAAILYQQCALRSIDANDRARARGFASRALDLTNATENYSLSEFPVSKGVSWDSAASLGRLRELINANALSVVVTTGRPDGGSWQQLVRSPFPAGGTRMTRDSLSALTTFVEDNFDRAFESNRRRIIFGGVDTTATLLYSSLLRAELTGDTTEVKRLRQTLGNTLSLRIAIGDQDSHAYKEALRLLRQGRADDHLRRLVQFIRMEGPLDLLHAASKQLIDALISGGSAHATDLLLLERSADLLLPYETGDAIRIAVKYANRDERDHAKRVESSLKTLSALVAGNPSCDMTAAAAAALGLMRSTNTPRDISIFAAFAGIAASLRWNEVDDDTKATWRGFFESSFSTGGARSIDVVRAFTALGDEPPAGLVNRMPDGEFVATVASDLLGNPVQEMELRRASQTAIRMINDLRAEAVSGRHSLQSFEPLVLGAYLVTQFSRTEVWPSLWAALNEAAVSTNDKIHSLRVLTDEPPSRNAIAQLSAVGHRPLADASEDVESVFFPVNAAEIGSLRLQFNLAYRLTTADQVQSQMLRMAASADSAVRSAIADACLYASLGDSDISWPRIVAMQLSYDPSGAVRNHAAHTLAYLSAIDTQSHVDKALRGRIVELFDDPGISALLGLLRGLSTAAKSSDVDSDLWCAELVSSAMGTHASHSVRRAAQIAMTSYDARRGRPKRRRNA